MRSANGDAEIRRHAEGATAPKAVTATKGMTVCQGRLRSRKKWKAWGQMSDPTAFQGCTTNQ